MIRTRIELFESENIKQLQYIVNLFLEKQESAHILKTEIVYSDKVFIAIITMQIF